MSRANKKLIVSFFCRPCGEYHYKDHPHYREMMKRRAARAKAKKKASE